jgi:hypothetical protein
MTSENVNQWDLLGSSHIRPLFQRIGSISRPDRINYRLGVSVNVFNGGDKEGNGMVDIKSIFLPFISSDLETIDAFHLSYKPTYPYIASGKVKVSNVYPSERINVKLFFNKLTCMRTGRSIDLRLLANVKNMLVISLVDVKSDESEGIISNNKAIEIAPLVMI